MSAEGAGLSGGQPQDFQSLKDNVMRRLLSTEVARAVPQFEILNARIHSQIPKPTIVQHMKLMPSMFPIDGFGLPSSARKKRTHT